MPDHAGIKAMMTSKRLASICVAAGACAITAVLLISPNSRELARTYLPWAAMSAPQHEKGRSHVDAHGHLHEEDKTGPEGLLKLSATQIEAAKITLAKVGPGLIFRQLTVPGTVVADADRLAHIAAKVAGTIGELRKRLGDTVAEGELIGAIDSREVADAKSQYIAAVSSHELQVTLFEREQSLWDKHITTEQSFLRARTATEQTRIRVDVARQKLSALGLDEKEIEGLPKASVTSMRRHELRSPIAGRVVDRKMNIGAPVTPESEVFIVADLSRVWIEVAVPLADLAFVKDGQAVAIFNAATGEEGAAKIIFISPLLDNDTRTARVVAEMDNPDRVWRPGTYVRARITTEEAAVDMAVPLSAVQTIADEAAVFVRIEQGFEKREIVLGRRDEKSVEVVFGLDEGETIAVSNTFVLKADLRKREAEHDH
jgi:cobalt-zinc-cadmium efflux system membrane fusion protein